jgi:hypothetical protein
LLGIKSSLIKIGLILSASLSLVYYFFFASSPALDNQSDLKDAQEVHEVVLAIEKTRQSSVNAPGQSDKLKNTRVDNELTTSDEQTDCDPTPQLSDQLEQEYIELLNEILGFDFTSTLHNEYQTYDEESLFVLADSGDAKAMIMLGFNYRWYARFESFNTQIFSTHIQQKPKKREQINLDYIRRSNEWFDQAAYHGLPNALSEKELNYALLIDRKQPDPLVNDEQMWSSYNKVMPALMQWVMPQHKDIMSISNAPEVTLAEADKQLLNLLKANWVSKRTQLDLPTTIHFNFSPELKAVLKQLSTCSKITTE